MASTNADSQSALCVAFQGLQVGAESAPRNADTVSTQSAPVQACDKASQPVLWGRLPPELKLETARWLPPAQLAKLLRVSHGIRALMLSDTSLWATIPDPTALSNDALRGAYLDAMLARAGSRPLSLEWRDPCEPSRRADPIRDAILRALPRVRKLSLQCLYFEAGPGTFWTAETPLLEELTVTDARGRPCDVDISAPVWSGSTVPRLRALMLGEVCFYGPPLQPFASVVHLEARMPDDEPEWEHLWLWFPQLESLVAHGDEESRIPEPPQSLRRVRLHEELPVCDWTARHRIQLLEIFVQDGRPLQFAVDFLSSTDPAGLWSAFFVPAAGSMDPAGPARAVLRGARATVVVWSDTGFKQASRLSWEGNNRTLVGRVQTLTVSDGAISVIFRHRFRFPALRALTIVNGELHIPYLHSSGGDVLDAPLLEELAVEVAHAHAETVLPHVPQFVARIRHDRRLREIVIRLPDTLDRLAPEIESASTELARAADVVRFEFCSAHRFRRDPCPDLALQL
ncbi:hypothetical protein AURDEDRAFT_175835 [Auricularia subglabra TFB-10046 SS5]|uniref:F-box domain-containing protein n=1 Tax=Auricularia subglabra (strain TFB-10046 / SS5) TaxID=717982 RepID=J0WSG3_AURST|nr:hypothetical protein AURDEDRAFT_175835 [Auricularia subglabra TFB-10046 SS5]